MNLQIVEAVDCKGVLTSVGTCIQCPYYLGRDEIVNEILCSNENKKSRKEEFEKQYKSFKGFNENLKMIEFGENNEKP